MPMKTEQEIREKLMVRAALAFRPPRLEFHSEVTPRMIELGREMERTLIMRAIRGAAARLKLKRGDGTLDYRAMELLLSAQGYTLASAYQQARDEQEKPLHPGESGV